MRGSVREHPGSLVTGSILNTGLDLRIQFPSGEVYGLTSARRHIPNAEASLHALYDMDAGTEPPGQCGIPLFGVLEKDMRWKLVASRTFPGGMVQSEYAR